MCPHVHPEEDEELVAAGVQAEQLDLEEAAAEAEVADAAERAEGQLAVTRVEITDIRAALAEARAAMAVPPAAPPADAVIHDIADDDAPEPGRFKCADDQFVLAASFETLAGNALRHQAWLVEEEAHTYAVAMARVYMCSDLDSLQWRGPSPVRVEQDNRKLAGAIASRDEVVAEAARDRARFHAQLAGLHAAAQAVKAAVAQAAVAEAEATSMARRIPWDSSLAEALERRRSQDEMSDRRRARPRSA
ncbi:hypothetical protein QYE76_032669 [Lolium multiflorum]|uniref:Uncharacterized protein n=1 Tax=Lolium multiflorum TaxID=4521 RepID=A0AAD8QVK5_LOLMU|nr:hypothetical protein QYE76_032669 [Lolium multiflorum]